jgi:hypothetical protein
VFDSVAWKAENIVTYPSNFTGQGKEYIRVTPVFSGMNLNSISISGVLNIDIFCPSGEGPKRTLVIADKLDKYLQEKSISTITGVVTQFYRSSLQPLGIDPVNPALHRYIYSIPFNHFGTL